MTLPYLVSLAFFTAFAVYVLLGMYAITLNSKAGVNRTFFAMCFSLSIWSFCYSIANSAQVYETALIWRRAASIGWGTFYSFMIHFFILLTGNAKVLKNKLVYVLIYLPGILIAYAYGINADLARAQFHLTNTAGGWVNSPTSSFWDLLYKVFYICLSTAVLFLLWQWGRKSDDKDIKKQAHLLITTSAIAFVFGTVADLLANKYIPLTIPQCASVIILIPIAAMYYSIRRYGLMRNKKVQEVEPGKILSGINIKIFYRTISVSFILGSMINFISLYFFYHEPLTSVILFSAVLFAYGILFRLIILLPKKGDFQDIISIILLLTIIPLISMRFIQYASITVWAIPFIFIIMSIVYNNRRLILWMGITIILTQICVWIAVPIKEVWVDGSDHLARIGIFGIALWLTYYINRIYINRLEENEAQIKFQKMISQISADFVKVTQSNLDEKINRLLKLSGEYFQIDRTYFISFSKNLKTCEWCNEGIESAVKSFSDLSQDDITLWEEHIKSTDIMHISNVEKLQPEKYKEKEILNKFKIKSLILLPVINKGKTLGCLCFATVRKTKEWQSDHQEWLKLLANILTDTIAKVEAENEIGYMAYYDSVTGLPNRILFKNRLEQAMHLTKRSEKIIGVGFLGLDSFKAVNDTMGHDVGDEMLKQVGQRLTAYLRKHDTVSRFGGDKFLFMITHVSEIEDIQKIVDKIMKSFDKPLTIKNQDFFISVSAGVAIYPWDGEDADTLIKNADMAMYVSKDKGKNQYALCSPDMKEDVLKKVQLTNNLYRALERNELVLYYQPQVSTLTQEIIGLEALIRWKHPDLGMISPGIFIPLAEQSGLINPIGQWVLKTACLQLKKWHDMGLPPIRIAVNLSVEQFKNPNLINHIVAILNETGLESQYLELEITESVVINEEENIIDILNKMKDLGVTIAIDDFGTEYSSLSRLKTFPVDRLKIDMQFVRGISEGKKDEAIAKTIIQLAKNLELNVIAEGVETEPQYEFFRKEMCDEIQGYYFYKPMPAEEIEKILLNQTNE